MYSMVLMMAMAPTPDASAFGGRLLAGHSCHGTVVVASHGCSGSSCHGSSCHGGGLLGILHHGSSCHGSSCHGMTASSGCHGTSCHGGHAGFLGLRSGHSCHGGCHGTVVSTAECCPAPAADCCGGAVMAAPAPAAAPAPTPAKAMPAPEKK